MADTVLPFQMPQQYIPGDPRFANYPQQGSEQKPSCHLGQGFQGQAAVEPEGLSLVQVQEWQALHPTPTPLAQLTPTYLSPTGYDYTVDKSGATVRVLRPSVLATPEGIAAAAANPASPYYNSAMNLTYGDLWLNKSSSGGNLYAETHGIPGAGGGTGNEQDLTTGLWHAPDWRAPPPGTPVSGTPDNIVMEPTFNLNRLLEVSHGAVSDVHGVMVDSQYNVIRRVNGDYELFPAQKFVNPFPSGTQEWWGYETQARIEAATSNTIANPVSPNSPGYAKYYEAPDVLDPDTVKLSGWTRTGLAADLWNQHHYKFTQQQEDFINQAYAMGKRESDAFFNTPAEYPSPFKSQTSAYSNYYNNYETPNPFKDPLGWIGGAGGLLYRMFTIPWRDENIPLGIGLIQGSTEIKGLEELTISGTPVLQSYLLKGGSPVAKRVESLFGGKALGAFDEISEALGQRVPGAFYRELPVYGKTPGAALQDVSKAAPEVAEDVTKGGLFGKQVPGARYLDLGAIFAVGVSQLGNPLAYPEMLYGAAQGIQKGISDVGDWMYSQDMHAGPLSPIVNPIWNAQVGYVTAIAGTLPFILSVPYGLTWAAWNPLGVLPKAYEMGDQTMEQMRIREASNPGSAVGTVLGMYTGGKLISPYVPQLPAIRYGEFQLPIETPEGLPKTQEVNVGAKPVLVEISENGKVTFQLPEGVGREFPDVIKTEPIQYYAKYKGLYLDTNYKLPFGFKTGDYYAGKTPLMGIGSEAGGEFGSAMRNTKVIGPAISSARGLPVTSSFINFIESRSQVPTGLWIGEGSPRGFGLSVEPRISGAIDFLSNEKAAIAYQKLSAVEHLINPSDVATLKAIIELRDITSSYPNLLTVKERFGETTPVSMKPETYGALQDYMNLNAKDMRLYGSLVGRVYLGEGGRLTLGDVDALLAEGKAQFHADNMWDIYLKKEFGENTYDISSVEKTYLTKGGSKLADILRIATKKGTGVYEPGVIDYSSPAYKNYMDAEVQYQQNFQSWMQRNKIPQQHIQNGLPYDPMQLRLAGITEPAPIRPRIEDFFPGKTVGGEVLSKLQSGSSQITGRRLMGLTPTGEHALDLHPISNLKYADTIPGTSVKTIPISDLIWGKQTIGNPPLGTITIKRFGGSDITIEAGGRVKDAFDTMVFAQTGAADAYRNPKISLELGMRLEKAANIMEAKVAAVDPMERIGGYPEGVTLGTFLKEYVNPLGRMDVQTAKFNKIFDSLSGRNRFFSGLPVGDSGYVEDMYKDYGWDNGGFLPPLNIGYYRNNEYKKADYTPSIYKTFGYGPDYKPAGYNPATGQSLYRGGYEPGNYKVGGYGLPEYKQGYTPLLTQGYNPTIPAYRPGLTPTYNPKVPYQPQGYQPNTPYTPQTTTPKTPALITSRGGFGGIPLFPVYPEIEKKDWQRWPKNPRRYYRKFNEKIIGIDFSHVNPATGMGARLPYLETRKRGFLDPASVIAKRAAKLPESMDIVRTSQKMEPIRRTKYMNPRIDATFKDLPPQDAWGVKIKRRKKK